MEEIRSKIIKAAKEYVLTKWLNKDMPGCSNPSPSEFSNPGDYEKRAETLYESLEEIKIIWQSSGEKEESFILKTPYQGGTLFEASYFLESDTCKVKVYQKNDDFDIRYTGIPSGAPF